MFKLFDLDLSMFGDGGEATAPESSQNSGVEDGAEAVETGAETAETGDADAENAAETEEKPAESFRDLIKGRFKEDFRAETQKIIDKRFRAMKGLEERVRNFDDLTERLTQMYGTNTLEEAIDKIESAYIADQAYQHGMSEEQYRLITEAERIKASRVREEREIEERRYIEETVARWTAEASEMQNDYPDFDLKTETDNNPKFLDLIKAGVPVRTAYEVSNLEAIKEKTKADAESKLAATIQSQKSRPKEAALSAGGAAGIKIDVSKLSAEERRSMAKRAQGGETIRL